MSSDFGYVHVDLLRLDRLLNLVGELVVNRTTFVDQTRRARARHGFKEQVLSLSENTERMGRISEQIQREILKARLVPIEPLFKRFERLVEHLSAQTDKEIELVMVGGRTEVDKRCIDELAEPLVHLVRNALDHGIEPSAERTRAGKPPRGTVTLAAHHEGNRLVVEVSDDGGGVDVAAVRRRACEKGLVSEADSERLSDQDALQLLFVEGFSTARQVTGMSGRGVGLDAARHRVELLGGRLEMFTDRGQGSRVRIDLPLTTAIVDALLVGVAGEIYALPLDFVQEVVHPQPQQLGRLEGREVLDLRGEAVALLYLSELLGCSAPRPKPPRVIVVLRAASYELGLVVDQIVERHEIVIKALGWRLTSIRGIVGASIGGDGNVVLVLDVLPLCEDAADIRKVTD